MSHASSFTGEYTNIGSTRARHDDLANPTLQTSLISVEMPEGYVFNDGNVPGVTLDHNDNQLYHPVTGAAHTGPASFACWAGSTDYTDFIHYFTQSTGGHADAAENAIEAVTFAAITGVTGTASTDILTKASHGLVNGDTVIPTLLAGGEGTGLSNGSRYAVVGVSGNNFQLSLTIGGSAINFTTNIVDCTLRKLLT